MTEGYVYRWTDSSNGKKYIGSHNGAKKHYKGSGLRFKNAYSKRPECFTREILYTGPDYVELEGFILETVDAMNDDRYYNLTNSSINPVLCGKDHPNYGKILSTEVKEKISKSVSGQKHHFYGKKHTEDSKTKMSENKLKSVRELSTGLRFDSIDECSKYFEFDRTWISKLLKKNKPVSRGPNKGKHFIYEEQNN